MVRSKFGFLSVYLSCFFILGFLSLGIFLLAHPETRLDDKSISTGSSVIPGMILFLGAFGWFYVLFRKVNVVTIDKDRLSVRGLFFRRVMSKSEIQSVDLLGRESFFGGNKAEGINIYLKDEMKLSLPDSLYRNMPELKLAIQGWYEDLLVEILNRQEKAGIPSSDREPTVTFTADIDVAEEFSGNYVTSINGVLFFGICIAFSWIALFTHSRISSVWNFLAFVIPISMSCFGFGMQFFYFRISGECLLIKNHLFFWYQKSYRLGDIQGVVLENPFRRSYSLRIRTNDFKSRTYGAGSLRKKDWQALRKRLEKLGKPVRNEMYLDV